MAQTTVLRLLLPIAGAVLFNTATVLADDASPAEAGMPAIAGWEDFIAGLEALPAAMLAKLPQEMRSDPQIQQEVGRVILESLTLSAINALGGDGDHPHFLPQLGELMNVGQPNADTIYRMAHITPGGSYRLRGKQGSITMSIIGQVGTAPSDPEGNSDHPGPTRNYLDINSLEADAEGNFDVLLSPKRPKGYKGDWWALHPQTAKLLLRMVSSDWENEQDPTFSIERIDIPAGKSRPSAAELERRLRQLPMATRFMATMFVSHVAVLREQGYVNKMKILDVSQTGGLDGQFYYEGAYDLADDEALIIEAKHPETCTYRSAILTNEVYETTDWYNNHSSLNGSQADIDKDGMLRIVVSEKDPGVPNWLDTAGYPRGMVQGRWTGCSAQPVPSVNKVALKDVRAQLPPDTPVVTPREREAIIRQRRSAFQQRPHW
jgi:hypothetical protein